MKASLCVRTAHSPRDHCCPPRSYGHSTIEVSEVTGETIHTELYIALVQYLQFAVLVLISVGWPHRAVYAKLCLGKQIGCLAPIAVKGASTCVLWLNWVCHEICRRQEWPLRLGSMSWPEGEEASIDPPSPYDQLGIASAEIIGVVTRYQLMRLVTNMTTAKTRNKPIVPTSKA